VPLRIKILAAACAVVLPALFATTTASTASASDIQPAGWPSGSGPWTLTGNYDAQDIYDNWTIFGNGTATTGTGQDCNVQGSASLTSNDELALTTDGDTANSCAEATSPFTLSPTSTTAVFIEYYAEMPTDSWAALWATGNPGPWPETGEIDTAEMLGQDKQCITFHYAVSGTDEQVQQCYPTGVDGYTTPAWGTYGVEWTPTELDFYYDGQWVATFSTGTAPNIITSNPEEILMDNVTAGTGEPGWDKAPRASSTMYIQYVRTWTMNTG
jgi:hypothetical protein